MNLVKLVYVSRPFGFDSAALNGILSDARRCNLRDDITGALICRADIYLQYLEGPKTSIEAAYARIMADDRHTEVKRLVSTQITTRMFPKWAMHDDPAKSLMWTQTEVRDGAVLKTSQGDICAMFEKIAQAIA